MILKNRAFRNTINNENKRKYPTFLSHHDFISGCKDDSCEVLELSNDIKAFKVSIIDRTEYYVKTLARIEADRIFSFGLLWVINSISKTRQSSFLLHFSV